MKKLRTFECAACGLVDDRFAEDGIETLECNKCKSPARLMLSKPKCFSNAAGTRSPSAL